MTVYTSNGAAAGGVPPVNDLGVGVGVPVGVAVEGSEGKGKGVKEA